MNFRDLLQEHNVPFLEEGHEHCRPDWIQLDCPFCSPGWKHWRMGYRISGHYVNCWTCGRHQLAETFALLADIPIGKARQLLRSISSERVERVDVRGKLQLPKNVGALKKPHKKYLSGRGFNPKQLRKLWGIGGIGVSSELAWRIFVPITLDGQTVSWTTRSITEHGRWRSAKAEQEAVDHKTLLYGEEYCRNSILVVEGPSDVWRVGPGAVATFGTGFTRAQVNRMVQYYNRTICFDNSPDAQKKAIELLEMLALFPGSNHNVIIESPDPGCATSKEIRDLRKHFLDDVSISQ